MATKRLSKGLSRVFDKDIDEVLNDIQNNRSDIASSNTSISLSEIRPNPYQPRKTFDEKALNELADSIREHGVFQPIIVRNTISGYEIIAGERRFRASKIVGLEKIPAIVVDFDDKAMMEISLLENIQREDLNAIEEATAYSQLIEKLSYTQDELAKRVGKSRSHIANMLRLLKLPEEVREMISDDKLSYGQARALINIGDNDKIISLAKDAVKRGLSVREVEKLAQEKKPKVNLRGKDPFIKDVENRMSKRLTTKVALGKNNINIYFHDTEDLNRILEILDCLEETEESL